MAYVPDPYNAAQPTGDVYAATAAAEFRALKARTNAITAATLGLGNVNNTSDVNKPLSAAAIAALAGKAVLGVDPINSQSAAYTLVLADLGKRMLHPGSDATARTFIIPANAAVPFDVGTVVGFTNGNGAGVLTIAITTDTMRLLPAGTTGSRTLAANGEATARKIAATEWTITGVGLT